MSGIASLPDLLRLVAVPVLGWAAYRDVRTRRVPNRTWPPLVALGVVLLAWEAWQVFTGRILVSRQAFLVRVAISLGIVVPVSYLFWWVGGFGGADAKALMTLAVLFPTFPTYFLPGVALPLERTTLGVFSLTVLSNTVVAGVAYPFALAARNALRGRFGPAMFVGRPVAAAETVAEYGRLLGTSGGFSRQGLDLDALRMYLTWRGTTLDALRADPERYRDPASLPAEPNPPGDGAIDPDPAPDSGADSSPEPERDPDPEPGPGSDPASDPESDPVGTGPARKDSTGTDPAEADPDDPWGAEAFLADIEGDAYGTTPEELRDGLDALATAETVWITPGIPFLVPMFAGLLVALVYGDLLVVAIDALVA